MLVQTEDPTVVRANPFEDPVAIEQAVVKHRDLRLALFEPGAIQPDDGHGRSPLLEVGVAADR